MCTLNVSINGGGEKEMFAGQQFKPKKKKRKKKGPSFREPLIPTA